MKAIISLLFLMLFIPDIHSQIDFENDPASFDDAYNKYYDYKRLNKSIDKDFDIKNDFDFELRFWIEPAPMSGRSLFLLRKKDDKWNVRFFTHTLEFKEDESIHSYWKEKELEQKGLSGLWQMLRDNHILTLPTLDSIRDKMRVYSADTLAAQGIYTQLSGGPYYNPYVLDGVSYRTELRTKDKKRSYSYHCPKGYLKECTNVEELYRAYAIVYLIFRRIGLNPDDIC
ncbi:hypothetical protein D0T84_09360 [Dysgonomonas sp. 521]|uniref:hypothetical protein n=1 Tax=Dysgonomonas sp. 521 TaxID=2302932 RepID=UPI0013D4E856|nr:hypothetical protein [Dysgonomonas sp. 521]NDV95126.1 hypothetical protein [Dysgonomonas sp. 521]